MTEQSDSSICSSAERPARVSPWRVNGAGLMIRVLRSPLSLLASSQTLSRDGLCGKTSPAFYPRRGELTSRRLSIPCCRSATAFRGGCLTLSSSECPKDAVASFLSDILATGGRQRQSYLTARACRGILGRMLRHGKKIPPQLRAALDYSISLGEAV